MKIASWNVNSIKARIEQFSIWQKKQDPDIILLQELKTTEENFPHLELSHLPYNYAINGQKTYNGVAILSKYTIDEINTVLPNNPLPDEARFIEILLNTPIGYTRIINLYIPNGRSLDHEMFDIKLAFLEAVNEYIGSIHNDDDNLIIGGDFNIAPFSIDMHDAKALKSEICCSYKEQEIMRKLLNMNIHDLFRIKNLDKIEYSWWDYRAGSFEKNHGLRIDFLLGNPKIVSKMADCFIDIETRSKEKASDHSPVIAVFC